MNRLDAIIQGSFPTVMVPAHQELEPLKEGMTRLLMAKNGLYLETNPPWGHLVEQLWESPRELPYGVVEERDTFKEVIENTDVLEIIRDEILPAAVAYALRKKEWAGWIIRQNGKYSFMPLNIDASGESVRYNADSLDEGACVVVDIHSHGRINPFFSETDDNDDAGGVKICIVMGNFREEYSRPLFDPVIRYAIHGFFIRRVWL